MALAPEEFVRRLVATQSTLRGYVLAHVQDIHQAEDVLQEVSVTLWRKLDSYRVERSFLGWAMGLARYEILRARRQSARSRLVFDDDLAERMAQRYEALEPELQQHRALLTQCVEKLPEHCREVIRRRYSQAQPIPQIAAWLGKSVGAVHMLLSRIRSLLAECTHRRRLDASGEATP